MTTMFCTNCGMQIEDDNLFCPFCGLPVAQDGAAEQPGDGSFYNFPYQPDSPDATYGTDSANQQEYVRGDDAAPSKPSSKRWPIVTAAAASAAAIAIAGVLVTHHLGLWGTSAQQEQTPAEDSSAAQGAGNQDSGTDSGTSAGDQTGAGSLGSGAAGSTSSSQSQAPVIQGEDAAFLEVLNDIRSKYGEPYIEAISGGDRASGLCMAETMELGSSDEDILVVAYYDPAGRTFTECGQAVTCNYVVEVYRYDSTSDAADMILQVPASSSTRYGDIWVSCSENSSGEEYLYMYYGMEPTMEMVFYGADSSGVFTELCRLQRNGDDDSFTVGGSYVSESEFTAAGQSYCSGFWTSSQSDHVESWYLLTGPETELNPTELDVSGTVSKAHETINDLSETD